MSKLCNVHANGVDIDLLADQLKSLVDTRQLLLAMQDVLDIPIHVVQPRDNNLRGLEVLIGILLKNST